MPRLQISDQDIANPRRLRDKLNAAYDQIYSLLEQMQRVERLALASQQNVLTTTERNILRALTIGSTSTTAAGQKPVVPTVSALPPVTSSTPGDLVRLSTDGVIYIFVDSTSGWVSITAAATAHNLLSATHGDTLAAAVVRGDIVVGNSTPKWSRFAKGAAFKLLRMNAAATDPEWGAVDDTMLSANVALENLQNVFTVEQDFQAAIALLLGGGTASNGATAYFEWREELITLSLVGPTTDSAADLITNPSLIVALFERINTTVSGGGVTTLQFGDGTTAARFGSTGALAAGNAATKIDHWSGAVATLAAGPSQPTATAKVRITADATPTQGKVYVAVLSLVFTAPTSAV